jgi:hypothetical protein
MIGRDGFHRPSRASREAWSWPHELGIPGYHLGDALGFAGCRMIVPVSKLAEARVLAVGPRTAASTKNPAQWHGRGFVGGVLREQHRRVIAVIPEWWDQAGVRKT